MKELIYVDAENVSRSVVIGEIEKVKGACTQNDDFIGKFYGARSAVLESIMPYLQQGLEYVDTSAIMVSRKNIVDMKISVDCVYDVFVAYRNDVRKVWVFTQDYDFVPLVYKLACMNVVVCAPLFREDLLPKSIGDIENALERVGYHPMVTEDWLKPQYSVISDLLGSCFTESIVCKYCSRKQRRFLDSLAQMVPQADFRRLAEMSLHEFSIVAVFKALQLSAADNLTVPIINLYTRKFFGRNFVSRDIEHAVKKLDAMIA